MWRPPASPGRLLKKGMVVLCDSGFQGTFLSSVSQASALPSEGARQSPRGESDPPEPTFGALGMALLLYWLVWKKRLRKTASHFLMAGSLYLPFQACSARKAILLGA